MSARSLKDLDQIQEKGSFRLSSGQARSLTAGMVLLLVLAFLVGLQVGIAMTPEEPEITHRDVASADRTIAEILDAYQAAPAPATSPAAAAATEAVAPEPDGGVPEGDGLAEGGDDAGLQQEEESSGAEPEPVAEEAAEEVVEEVVEEEPEPVVEAPEEPEPVGPALPELGAGKFGVQLAAFPTRGEADGLAQALSGHGITTYIMEATVKGNRWYRVRVGPFSSRGDAEAWIPELAQHTEFTPIVVKD